MTTKLVRMDDHQWQQMTFSWRNILVLSNLSTT